MSRHAYLIMAHDNFDLLRYLLSKLDDERNGIYLHIDAKAGTVDEASFSSVLKSSRLTFVDRMSVNWGGFSQVRCELGLLKASVPEHYDYYHLLSGSDLPLKSQNEIHAFFDEHSGKEFVAFDKTVPESAYDRVRLRHFFVESSSPLARPADHALSMIQQVLRVDRLRGTGISLRKGSNWFSITDALANYVIEKESWIFGHFSHALCPDELFLQTLAADSECPFRENIFDIAGDRGSFGNLRYIDWERGDGNSPYTFREEDRGMLLAQPHLFARKFDKAII